MFAHILKRLTILTPEVTVRLNEINATNTKTRGSNDSEYKSTFYSVLTRDIYFVITLGAVSKASGAPVKFVLPGFLSGSMK
jgi:hypothetical protein